MPVSSFPDFFRLRIESSCAIGSVLKVLPALFCSPVREGHLPVGPIDSLLEELEVGFPKIQGPDLVLCLTRIPHDCRLHQCMVTAAQAASDRDITDELTCIGDQQVQYRTPLGRAVHYPAQGVLLCALQESPGLPAACRAAFPADIGVADITWQDESQRARSLLEQEEETFLKTI